MNKEPFWETGNRNLTIAAFLMVAIVGGLYFFAGSLSSMIWVFIDTFSRAAHGRVAEAGSYLDMLKRGYERYQGLILGLTMALEFLFFVGLTVILFRNWHALPIRTYFRLRTINPLKSLLAAGGLVLLVPFISFTGEIFLRFFPTLKKLEEVGNVLLTAKDTGTWILLVLAIGVTPAICEEFLFRGYFQRTLERRWKQPWSYLISGLFFALIHQNYFGLFALILAGVYLGYVFQRFQSILPGALSHFCYNTTLVIMANRPDLFRFLVDQDGFLSWQAVLSSALLGGVAIVGIWFWSRKESPPADSQQPTS